MTLKSKLWMTGSLEWFTYIGDTVTYLGKREVPSPLEEGDTWTNELGEIFKVNNGLIEWCGQDRSPQTLLVKTCFFCSSCHVLASFPP